MGVTVPLTLYAPAERADPEQLQRDVRRFAADDLMDQFLAAVPDIFMVLNEQRQIVYANRALLELAGVESVAQIAGMRTGDALGCVHAFDTEWGCGTSEFCRECGAVRAILSSVHGHQDVQECSIVLPEGGALELRVRTRPFQLEGRRYILFAVNDIADEKRRRVLERLFFHDILNTAGGMLGYAELVRVGGDAEEAELKEAVFHLAANLVEEIKHQQNLIAAEAGELAVQESLCDAFEVLAGVRETLVHHEVAVGRQIVIAPEAAAIAMMTDKTLLRRVLSNMVKNALEACSAGQIVTLSCVAVQGKIQFSVHNPNYIPRNLQLQIFQRSFSTKGLGRGLGAYSMKLLSERYLNGKVWFKSAPSAGTTFYALYPQFPPEVSACFYAL
jgi:signal transduction histidine kinase